MSIFTSKQCNTRQNDSANNQNAHPNEIYPRSPLVWGWRRSFAELSCVYSWPSQKKTDYNAMADRCKLWRSIYKIDRLYHAHFYTTWHFFKNYFCLSFNMKQCTHTNKQKEEISTFGTLYSVKVCSRANLQHFAILVWILRLWLVPFSTGTVRECVRLNLLFTITFFKWISLRKGGSCKTNEHSVLLFPQRNCLPPPLSQSSIQPYSLIHSFKYFPSWEPNGCRTIVFCK